MSGSDDQALAAKIVAAVDRLARGHRAHRQAVASRHGLTPLQLDLLATLAAGPPPDALVGLLARELGITQPTVTDSLRALERKGLVERCRDPADRRRTTIVLTGPGTTLVEALHRADDELVTAVAALPGAEQEAAFEALLTLIARQVDAGVVAVARTCLTCRFHEGTGAGGHHCALLDLPLRPADLRVHCPEHEAAPTAAGTG